MKKFLKTGKKTLSVIMAVLMVMTAWVWVAPTEASAATAGKYTVKVHIDINNGMYSGDEKMYVDYYTNNGTGTTGTEEKAFSTGTFNEDTTETFTNVNGFPYRVRVYCSGSNLVNAKVVYGVKVYIVTDSGDVEIYNNGDNEFTHSSGVFSTVGEFTDTVTIPKSKYPYVNTFPTATKSRDIYLPNVITSGRYSSNTVTIGQAKDQYGVNYMDPETITVSGSVCGTTGLTTSKSGSVLTVTGANNAKNENGTSQTATVVAKWKSANTSYDAESEYRSKTYSNTFTIYNPEHKFTYDGNGGTVTMTSAVKYYADTIGSSFPSSGTRTGYTFLGMYADNHDISYETNLATSEKLTSSKVVKQDKTWYAAWQANQYSMTFKYRDADGQWVTSDPVTEYYGRNIPFPTVTSPVNDGVDYTYTFTGWSPAHTTVQAVDNQEYIADYDEVVHYADKTGLNNAIAAANAKLAEQKYIDGGYTEESVKNFEDALQDADDALGMVYFLSQQSALDSITNSLIRATNNLTTKKYIVMFVDEDGTILKDGYHFVEYGDSVDVPAAPTQSPDADYHYEFVEWNSNLSDGLDACNYVTDDLRYIATFDAIPHSFTETKTPSTCTADGVITKTCDCGYSYTVADPDDLAGHRWSTDYKELVPATCATAGSEAKYCTVCGAIDESSKREIAKLGHNFGSYTEYTPATCFGKGAEIAVCSRCEAKDVKEIPQKSHIYGDAETVEKTCTTDGYTKKTCTLCGFTDMTVDKATGHDLSETTTAATCVSVGYEKTTCAKCDYEKTVIIPATGTHTYPATWTKVSDASCVGHGVEKRVCTVCNSATETRLTDLAQHTSPAEWTVEVPATCDGDGRQVKNCTVCGKELEAETITKLGHNYEAYAEGTYAATCTTAGATAVKCSRCGDINTTVLQPTGHKFEKEGAVVETAATCTSSAYKTYNCDNCDYSYVEHIVGSTAIPHDFTGTETIIDNATCETDGKKTVQCKHCDTTTEVILPKLGHSYGNWEVVKAATNTVDGQWKRVCANNAEHVEYLTIPKGGHAWDSGTVTEAASCEATGTMVYKCTAHTDCGVTLEVTIPVTQHTVAQKVTAATCTEKGKVEAYCSVCDAECANPFSTTETPVVPHTLDNGTEVEATCTTSGYTLYKCIANDCGFEYKEYNEDEKAKAHTYVATETNAATCTNEGLMTYTCACGASYTAPISPTGHNYEVAENKATCTTAGTKVYTCACGDSYTEFVSETAAHNWGSWSTIQEATTDSYGIEKRECSVCHTVEHKTTAPTGAHEFKNMGETPASCTQEGSIIWKCQKHDNCEADYTETLDKLPHTQKLDYTAPTCISAGYSKLVCSVCGAEILSETIPATGIHDFSGEGVKVDATCINTGTMTYTCQTDGCDATKTENIPAKGHDLTTEVFDSKCVEKGKVVITCSRCDDPTVEKTYELAAKNHSWKDAPESTEAAECEKDGSETYKCQFCDETNVVVVPKLGHDWGEWVKTDATTTADGAWTRTCSACNETETLVIPMGHNLVKDTVNSKAATCSAEGKEVYKCNNHDNCGITIEVTLSKLQHTVAQREIEATCKAEGRVEAYCTVCKDVLSTEAIPVKAHNYVAGEEVEPTCTTSGYTVYKCAGCNETYNEINGDALGHDLVITPAGATCTKDGKVVITCKRCDFKQEAEDKALGHNYQKISTTAATCAAAATETYKCSRCDAQYTISVGEKAKEHSYSENWTTVQEATPTSIGYRTRTCSVCGQLDVDTIEATGEHKFETGEIVNTVPATCTENGYVERKCSVHTGESDCGKTANITIPATGHTEEAIAAVAATCEKEGSSAGSKCSVCGTMLVAPVTLPALDHKWGNEKVTPATCQTEGKIEYTCTRDCGATETRVIAIDENAHNLVTTVEQATCTADGKVTESCQNEGCNYSEVTAAIPAKGHTFTGAETTVSKATCTNDGSKTVKCANCDEVNTVIIPKLGHKMMAGEKVDPTCTTSGYTPYTCANRCGESYRVYDETVKEHNYVQVEGSSTATCIAGGTVTMKCSHCDDEITAEVPALGHSYGEWTTVNPTAEVEGSKTRKCDRCDATETVILPKLGHDMVKDEAASTAATCTEKGRDVYVCTTHTGDAACGYTYSVELPAKGHSYDEGTVKAGDEATCDKDGVKTFTCACGDEYTQVIPMTGHKLSTTVTEATCKDAGSVVTECTNSGCDHKVEKVLAKLPHTISVSYAYPGCDKGGYVKEKCDKCDYENIISTVPALGHSYTGEETVVKEASCLEKGEKTVKCSRCDESVTVEIPAKGHSYVAGAEVPATCTESGYIPYECACGSSYKELVSNPNGHKWNTQPEAGSVIATCVVDGKVTYKCQFCDAKNEVITPKFGHSWSAWEVVINPTATVDGVQMRKCLRGCGATESVIIPALGGTTTYTVSFVVDGKTVATQTVNHGSAATAPEISNKAPDAKYHYSFIWDTDFTKVTSDLTVTAVFTPAAHDFGEWVIDLEANCNRDGARHRVCSCGYTESEVIPATEHDFSEIKEEKAATCTENGYKVVVCKNCGATERQTIKRLGHLMNYFEGVEATCDRDGVAAHYTCSRCGKSFEDRAGKVELTDTVIKKRYHTYVVVEGSDPTCTKEGVTDYRYCTACGYTQHPEKIPATGHADVNNDNTCDKCGATYMQGGEVICSCRCHKNGFFNELIYKILSFFWRLFGSNKSCECGKVHY